MTSESPQAPFEASLKQALQTLQSLCALERKLEQAAEWCIEALDRGHKVLACGNGGSASQAQHFVGELMGRYKGNRPALPAIALTADSTVLTCIGNDYRYDEVFSRQVQALGRPGDVLVAFSTSGNSPNVLTALKAARSSQVKSIAFLGSEGGAASALADCSLIVAHQDTARIQEGHLFLIHVLMEYVESEQQHE